MHVRVAHIRPTAPATQTAGPAVCLLALTILWLALMTQVGFVPSSPEGLPMGRAVSRLKL
jgi:hypothetical protein